MVVSVTKSATALPQYAGAYSQALRDKAVVKPSKSADKTTAEKGVDKTPTPASSKVEKEIAPVNADLAATLKALQTGIEKIADNTSKKPKTPEEKAKAAKKKADDKKKQDLRDQNEAQRKYRDLLRAVQYYYQETQDLLSYPLYLIQEAIFGDPHYGQYAEVPNAGWSKYPFVSRNDLGMLTIPEKAALGQKNPENNKPFSIEMNAEGFNSALAIKEKEGRIHFPDSTVQTLAPNLLKDLDKIWDVKHLESAESDLDKLAYTTYKDMRDNLELMLSPKKLEERTGIKFNYMADDGMYQKWIKDAGLFPNNCMLMPDIDYNNKEPATWWMKSDKVLAEEKLVKGSDWKYVYPHLFRGISTEIGKHSDINNAMQGMDPYYHMTPLAKALINGYRKNVADELETSPRNKEIFRERLSDNKMLFTDEPFDKMKTTPVGYDGIPGLTRMVGIQDQHIKNSVDFLRELGFPADIRDSKGFFDFSKFAPKDPKLNPGQLKFHTEGLTVPHPLAQSYIDKLRDYPDKVGKVDNPFRFFPLASPLTPLTTNKFTF